MSKKKKTDNSYFIYNFIFLLGLIIVTNFLVRFISRHDLLPQNPLFEISYVHNSGAAFSLLNSRIPFLIAVGVLALIYIVFRVYISKKGYNRTALFGFSAMAAGITHNLYERIHYGFVIDYFDLNFVHFAIFNMADVLITFGAVILIYQILVKKL